jgi:hypothetical protein
MELPRYYYSPRNRERPTRRGTEFIILHTTEGSAAGSLKKLSANGEAHYMIDEKGRLYRILHRDKVAYHAGTSLWNGKSDLDSRSIGIEVVGYHDKSITAAQVKTLRSLLATLKPMYKIPDDRVLTHSMVACSPPNQWYKRSHRGRKRCGMQFADPALRKRLGLNSRPLFDPDVRAGRLIEADPYLAAKLYPRSSSSRTATAKPAPAPASATTPRPGGGLQQIGKHGTTAFSIAGTDYNKSTTHYFLPSGEVKSGKSLSQSLLEALPPDTRILVGYTAGKIEAKRSAFDICKTLWNSPSTYYFFPDRSLRPGNTIKENAIPLGTVVFYRANSPSLGN